MKKLLVLVMAVMIGFFSFGTEILRMSGMQGLTIRTLPDFKVLDVSRDGCRVQWLGDSSGSDFFIYGFEGLSDRFYKGNNIWVKSSGNFKYTTVLHTSRTIPAFTVISESEVAAYKSQFKAEQEEQRQEQLRINAEAKVATEKTVLQWTLNQAEKGNATALRMLGERYRDGNGVEKDPKKSDEYFKRAEEIDQADIKKINEKKRIEEQANYKKKFIALLPKADDPVNPNRDAVLFIEKCYREGLGVKMDLNKAEEYRIKATGIDAHSTINRTP